MTVEPDSPRVLSSWSITCSLVLSKMQAYNWSSALARPPMITSPSWVSMKVRDSVSYVAVTVSGSSVPLATFITR